MCLFLLFFTVLVTEHSIVKNENIKATVKKLLAQENKEIDFSSEPVQLWQSVKQQLLGDTIGCTQYDRQWNLAPHRRLVYDPVNNLTHSLFMRQIPPAERHMRYNCYDGTSWLFGTGCGGGVDVQTLVKDGFGTIDYLPTGEAIVAFHKMVGRYFRTAIYKDIMPGMGSFEEEYTFPPSVPDYQQIIWPRIAVDNAGNRIVVTHPDTVDDIIRYAYSPPTVSWSDWIPVDTSPGLTYNAFGSKYSQKLCIVWGKDFLEEGLWNGHILFKESQDGGVTWGPITNITSKIHLPTNHWYTMEELRNMIGNTYGIYDISGYVHIVTDASMGTADVGHYYPFLSSVIWHYSQEFDTITIVTRNPLPDSTAIPDFGHLYPLYGQWATKPVIGEDPRTKYLYVIWSEFPYDTVTFDGYEIGEIYGSYSLDRGITWAPKINISNSGLCEVFVSLPPIVNDTLKILYMYDKNNRDDIVRGQLDPDTCRFMYFELPTIRGDVEVTRISYPPSPPNLVANATYSPRAWYKNVGNTPIAFQARFEIIVDSLVVPFDYDSLLTPVIYYYGIKNVPLLAPGDSIEITFRPWKCDTEIVNNSYYNAHTWYYAYASFFVDTNIANNTIKTQEVWVEELSKKIDFNISLFPTISNKVNIRYSLPKTTNVLLKVYDIIGREVITLLNKKQTRGEYSIDWNGINGSGNKISSGVYFIRFVTDIGTKTGKVILVK